MQSEIKPIIEVKGVSKFFGEKTGKLPKLAY